VRLSPLLLFALTLDAQTPSFEVASVRPISVGYESMFGPRYVICQGVKPEAENVRINTTLNTLVIEAYSGEVDRFDLPAPRSTVQVEVSVRIPSGTTLASCRQMLQKLLSERFHLITNVEPGEITAYFLKVAKSGLKLKPTNGPPPDRFASADSARESTHWTITYRTAPFERVYTSLALLVNDAARRGKLARGNLIDETGLTGYYDGKLELDGPLADMALASFSLESELRNALSSQLGLTFETRRTVGKVLSIRSADSVPTEN